MNTIKEACLPTERNHLIKKLPIINYFTLNKKEIEMNSLKNLK